MSRIPLLLLVPVFTVQAAAQAILMDALPAAATEASAGTLQLSGTLAQAAANTVGGGGFTLTAGFAGWDRFPPVANCQPVEVTLSTGAVSILTGNVDGGSSDNVAIAAMTLVPSTFTAPGDYTVTLTVLDDIGHKASCTTVVTVLPEPTRIGDWTMVED